MIPTLLAALIVTAAGAHWLLRKYQRDQLAELRRLSDVSLERSIELESLQAEVAHEKSAHAQEMALLHRELRAAEAGRDHLDTLLDEQNRAAARGLERIQEMQLRLEEQKEELDARQRRADQFRGEYDDALEDARFWQAQADHLRELYEKANADAINAREIVADWVAQRTFGRSIFHKAPPLPEESKHKQPIPKSRIQGRLAVQLADREFAKQEREMLARRREAAVAEAARQQQAANQQTVNPTQETPVELSQSV